MKRNEIIIRAARPADLASINAIYNYYVAHSTCVWTTTPCSEAEREAWYREHGASMPVLVAESSGRVLGWGALGSFRTACTLAREPGLMVSPKGLARVLTVDESWGISE